MLERIDRITEERNNLQVLCETIQKERGDLLLSLEGMKIDINMKDEEVIKATNLLENMSERIISKDKMIDLIKTERDEAVAMIENENFKKSKFRI